MTADHAGTPPSERERPLPTSQGEVRCARASCSAKYGEHLFPELVCPDKGGKFEYPANSHFPPAAGTAEPVTLGEIEWLEREYRHARRMAHEGRTLSLREDGNERSLILLRIIGKLRAPLSPVAAPTRDALTLEPWTRRPTDKELVQIISAATLWLSVNTDTPEGERIKVLLYRASDALQAFPFAAPAEGSVTGEVVGQRDVLLALMQHERFIHEHPEFGEEDGASDALGDSRVKLLNTLESALRAALRVSGGAQEGER